MILTKVFGPDQYAEALESWGWLDVAGKTPVLSSAFGDVFFSAPDGFWFLDTVEGTLTRRWESVEQLRAELQTQAGQQELLLVGLATAAHSSGLVLEPDEVYDFKVPPVLGGELVVENLSKMDGVVSVHLAGQIHQQLTSLPPGTAISGFTVDDSPVDPSR